VSSYRERYGMHASSGILYNHESPRRAVGLRDAEGDADGGVDQARLADELRLGDLDATRDWGHARDFAEAMWLMLQQHEGDDYVGVHRGEQDRAGSGGGRIRRGRPGLERYVVVDPAFVRAPDPVCRWWGSPQRQRAARVDASDDFEEMMRDGEADLRAMQQPQQRRGHEPARVVELLDTPPARRQARQAAADRDEPRLLSARPTPHALHRDRHPRGDGAGQPLALQARDRPRDCTFQIGRGAAKLVRWRAGEIFDVVVDIRLGSPTFGEWEGFTLTDDNMHSVYVRSALLTASAWSATSPT